MVGSSVILILERKTQIIGSSVVLKPVREIPNSRKLCWLDTGNI